MNTFQLKELAVVERIAPAHREPFPGNCLGFVTAIFLSAFQIPPVHASICGLNGLPSVVAERLIEKIRSIVPETFSCDKPATLSGEITCLGSLGNHVSIAAADSIKYFRVYVVFDRSGEGIARAAQVLTILSQERAFPSNARQAFALIEKGNVTQASSLLDKGSWPATCSLNWKIDTRQFALGYAPGWR